MKGVTEVMDDRKAEKAKVKKKLTAEWGKLGKNADEMTDADVVEYMKKEKEKARAGRPDPRASSYARALASLGPNQQDRPFNKAQKALAFQTHKEVNSVLAEKQSYEFCNFIIFSKF